MHLKPQTAGLDPFIAPFPAISQLAVFGFNTEKSENGLNLSERWKMEFSFFKKKVVSSAQTKGSNTQKSLSLQIWGSFLIKINKISTHKMNT